MRNILICLFTGLFFSAVDPVKAQNISDTLCATPPMGWNSWNFFEGRISDGVLRRMADAMVSNGMKRCRL
jgi:alpha-galactosidase